MQKLTLSHPPNVVIAESVPKRTLAELGKLLLMFTVRLESNLAG
jgi:Kef-type K+ transport system membrane component KefB